MAKMSPETKARLREYADKKKAATAGRKSLMGLDQTTGLALLDKVQDGDTVPKPDTITFRDGVVRWVGFSADDQPSYPLELAGHVPFRYAPHVRNTPREKAATGRAYKLRRDVRSRAECTWVRFRRCPAWVVDEFRNRFPWRSVAAWKYAGPGQSNAPATDCVFPTPVVLEWLRLLWPDRNDLGKRIKTNVEGWTDRAVRAYPGLGALVTCDDPEFVGMTGRVEQLHPVTGRAFATFRRSLWYWSTVTFDPESGSRTSWDVVGAEKWIPLDAPPAGG